MKKLFSFLKPYRISMTVAIFLMLFELIVELMLPLIMAKIIDEGVLVRDLSLVLRWGAIMIGISLLSFALVEFNMPFLLMVMNISILGVLWFGSIQINAGEVKVGEVVAIVNYGTRIASAMSMFSMIIIVFSRAKASGQRILEVLETEGNQDSTIKQKTSSPRITKGKVVFDSVTFQYPGTDSPVLKNISFQATPGSTIAILGATGSGKTSLFQLIPRLYEVNGGTIYIDDQNIQSFPQEYLRKQIGFVPQESLLFTGTINENLAWGKEDASQTEMIEAAKHAQIDETIQKTENSRGFKAVNKFRNSPPLKHNPTSRSNHCFKSGASNRERYTQLFVS